MPSEKSRLMVTVDYDTHELLRELSDLTGLSQAAIINRLLSSHVTELWEYKDWLAKQPDSGPARNAALNLLVSYGPDNLFEGIRRLDPEHQFQYEKFVMQARGKVEPTK